jgi:hypothetical protein
LNPDHEYYSVIIASRDDRFEEALRVERAGGKWFWKMLVKEQPTGRIVVDCEDPGFPSDSHVPTKGSCFPNFTIEHQGDAHVPLVLPKNSNDAAMTVAIIGFASLVFWPLYAGLALWWMDEHQLMVPEHSDGDS